MTEAFVLTQLLPLLFFLCGIGLCCAALYHHRNTQKFLASAVETTGTVVALNEESSNDTDSVTGTTYRPVIGFRIDAARAFTFESMVHSNPPLYRVGDTVPVLYNPLDPNQARIRSFTYLRLLPILLGGLGVLFSGLGLGLWLMS